MRLLFGEWDYIINDETLQKENQVNLALQFQERLKKAIPHMEETSNSELVITTNKKPVLTVWDETRTEYKTIILEEEDKALSAEILAFAGSITTKSGVAPLGMQNPLNFTYEGLSGRIFRSNAGVTVVLQKEAKTSGN